VKCEMFASRGEYFLNLVSAFPSEHPIFIYIYIYIYIYIRGESGILSVLEQNLVT